MIEDLNDIRPGDVIMETRFKNKKTYVCIDTNLNGDDEYYSKITVVDKEEIDKYLKDSTYERCIVDEDNFETAMIVDQYDRRDFDLLDEKYKIFKAYVIEKENTKNDKTGTD